MGNEDDKSLPEVVAALLPRWQESFFAVDFALLLGSPVFYGSGIPRGNGDPVVLIPGFLHGDTYLIVLYSWLSKMGYRPYYSGIGFNADCPNLLVRDTVMKVVRRARKETHRKVHLVGHSFGGIIARSIAAQYPRDIASVVTLGSPFRRSVVHKAILEETDIVRRYIIEKRDRVRPECYTPQCGCAFMRALRKGVPPRMRFTAVYTVNDGVVDWRFCQTGNVKVDVAVKGTHAGLVFNPAVYRVIAESLAAGRVKNSAVGA